MLSSRTKKTLILGFMTWLIPFLIAFLIFPLKQSGSPLFETIMPIAITAVTLIAGIIYFKNETQNYFKQAINIGLGYSLDRHKTLR